MDSEPRRCKRPSTALRRAEWDIEGNPARQKKHQLRSKHSSINNSVHHSQVRGKNLASNRSIISYRPVTHTKHQKMRTTKSYGTAILLEESMQRRAEPLATTPVGAPQLTTNFTQVVFVNVQDAGARQINFVTEHSTPAPQIDQS